MHGAQGTVNRFMTNDGLHKKQLFFAVLSLGIQRLYHEINGFEKSDIRRRTTEGNEAAAGIVVVADAGTDAVTVATGTGSAEDKVWAAQD